MSKVVTIPKDRNPFVVIVNGVKHSYPAGVTTEVPDEVADVIEKYVGAKPKPDPNAGINFGGVQSDWNQTDSSATDFIKNKPFVIVNLDFETFSIDKTAAEIKQLAFEGKIVLLGADGARFSPITDVDGNLTGVSASTLSVLPASSDTIPVQATTYLFDPDGNFVGIETGTFNVSRDA